MGGAPYVMKDGTIIYSNPAFAPPGAVPVSAPPPPPPPPASSAAPSGAAPSPTAHGGDYQQWLKRIGMFSGLANTGGLSSNELVAGILDPNSSDPAAAQGVFSGLTPSAPPPPPEAPPAAQERGAGGFHNRHEIPGYAGAYYFTDDAGNIMTNTEAPTRWQVINRSGKMSNPDKPFIQSIDQSSALQQIDWRAIGMVAAPFTAGYSAMAPAAGAATTAGADAAATTAATAAEGAGAAAVPGASGGMLSSIPSWAYGPLKTFGLGMLSTGGDVKAAATGAALHAGIGYGADAAAPYVNDAATYAKNYFDNPATDEIRRQGMSTLADTALPSAGMLPADGMMRVADGMPPAIQPDPSFGRMPMAVPEADPTFGGALAQTAPGVFSAAPITPSGTLPGGAPQDAPPADPNAPPATKPAVSSQDLQRYAKVAMQVQDFIGAAKGPTQPAADSSPEEQQQYYSDVVNYLGLDAKAMADAGLKPGSPEYMDYILKQADTVIAQVLDGMNVDSADLGKQLRTKTDQELQQLQRALYVRGQLGQQMGAGTYVDPIGGKSHEVIGGGTFDPNVAAYQRGIAGNVDELGGKHGQGAYDYLRGMLGRHADAFGMQGAADEHYQQALRNEQNPDEQRRRRGMLG